MIGLAKNTIKIEPYHYYQNGGVIPQLKSHFAYILSTMELSRETSSIKQIEDLQRKHQKIREMLEESGEQLEEELFYYLKNYLKSEVTWRITKFHVEKVLEHLESKQTQYPISFIRAINFEAYLFTCRDEKGEFEKRVREMIDIHMLIEKEIGELIKKEKMLGLF